MIQEGDKAPDFTLPDSEGNMHSLSDYTDLVLYFYPEDMTRGCTVEAQNFRRDHDQFQELEYEIVGISPDSIGSHKEFKMKYDLPFTLLADEDHKVASKYGVWDGKLKRTTFIIEDGEVRKVFTDVDVDLHSDEVLDSLRHELGE